MSATCLIPLFHTVSLVGERLVIAINLVYLLAIAVNSVTEFLGSLIDAVHVADVALHLYIALGAWTIDGSAVKTCKRIAVLTTEHRERILDQLAPLRRAP